MSRADLKDFAVALIFIVAIASFVMVSPCVSVALVALSLVYFMLHGFVLFLRGVWYLIEDRNLD